MRSFEINHKELKPGIYKHSVSGLVTTWDVRVKTPNVDAMEDAVLHSIEHTLAVYMRNRFGNYRIVGVFPMACKTGFYVLTRFIGKETFLNAFVDFVFNLQKLITVPGATEVQCGNYELHDLKGAKTEILNFYDRYLRFLKATNMKY